MAEAPSTGGGDGAELGRLQISSEVDNSGIAAGMAEGEEIVARGSRRMQGSLDELRAAVDRTSTASTRLNKLGEPLDPSGLDRARQALGQLANEMRRMESTRSVVDSITAAQRSETTAIQQTVTAQRELNRLSAESARQRGPTGRPERLTPNAAAAVVSQQARELAARHGLLPEPAPARAAHSGALPPEQPVPAEVVRRVRALRQRVVRDVAATVVPTAVPRTIDQIQTVRVRQRVVRAEAPGTATPASVPAGRRLATSVVEGPARAARTAAPDLPDVQVRQRVRVRRERQVVNDTRRVPPIPALPDVEQRQRVRTRQQRVIVEAATPRAPRTLTADTVTQEVRVRRLRRVEEPHAPPVRLAPQPTIEQEQVVRVRLRRQDVSAGTVTPQTRASQERSVRVAAQPPAIATRLQQTITPPRGATPTERLPDITQLQRVRVRQEREVQAPTTPIHTLAALPVVNQEQRVRVRLRREAVAGSAASVVPTTQEVRARAAEPPPAEVPRQTAAGGDSGQPPRRRLTRQATPEPPEPVGPPEPAAQSARDLPEIQVRQRIRVRRERVVQDSTTALPAPPQPPAIVQEQVVRVRRRRTEAPGERATREAVPLPEVQVRIAGQTSRRRSTIAAGAPQPQVQQRLEEGTAPSETTAAPSPPPDITQTQRVRVRRERIVLDDALQVPAPPAPPVLQQEQRVNVRRRVVVDAAEAPRVAAAGGGGGGGRLPPRRPPRPPGPPEPPEPPDENELPERRTRRAAAARGGQPAPAVPAATNAETVRARQIEELNRRSAELTERNKPLAGSLSMVANAMQQGASADQAMRALQGMGASASNVNTVLRTLTSTQIALTAEMRKGDTEARKQTESADQLARAEERAGKAQLDVASRRARSARPSVEQRLREAATVSGAGPVERDVAGRFRGAGGRFVSEQTGSAVEARNTIDVFGQAITVTQQNEHAVRALANVEAQLDERQRLLRQSILGTAQAAARQATEMAALAERSRPAVVAAERLAVLNRQTNVVKVAGETRQVTSENRAELEGLAGAAGTNRARQELAQRPFDDREQAARQAVLTRQEASEIAARSTPAAIEARTLARQVQGTRPEGAAPDVIGRIRVAGQTVDVTADNARQHQDDERAALAAARAQDELEESTLGVVRAEEQARAAAAAQARALADLAERATTASIAETRRQQAEIAAQKVVRVQGVDRPVTPENEQDLRGAARDEGEQRAAARIRAQGFGEIADAADKAATAEAEEADVARRSRPDALNLRLGPAERAAAARTTAREGPRLPASALGRRVQIGEEQLTVSRENIGQIDQLARQSAKSKTEVVDLNKALSGTKHQGPQSAVEALKNLGEQASITDRLVAGIGKGFRSFDNMFKGVLGDAARFGLTLIGVEVGLSVLAGAARIIHGIISDAVKVEFDWERTARSVNALYGQRGQALRAFAQTAATLPGVTADRNAIAQASVGLREGLRPPATAPGQVDQGPRPQTTDVEARQVALQAARLASLHPETNIDQITAAIQDAVSGGGGEELAKIGVRASPADLAERFLGVRSASAFEGGFDPRRRRELALAAIQTQTNEKVARDRDRPQGLDAPLRAKEQAAKTLQARQQEAGQAAATVQGAITEKFNDFNIFAADVIRLAGTPAAVQRGRVERADILRERGFTERVTAGPASVVTDNATGRPIVGPEAQAILEAADESLRNLSEGAVITAASIQKETDAQAKLNAALLASVTAAERATGAQVAFLERVGAAAGRIGREEALAAAAEGPEIGSRTPEDIGLAARNRANKAAEQLTTQAERRRIVDANAERLRAQQQVTPESIDPSGGSASSEERGRTIPAAAKREQAEVERRTPIETRIGTLEQQRARQDLVTGTAQAALDQTDRDRQRRQLVAGVQSAPIQANIIGVESQLAPIQLAQAALQDRIAVAQRTNLDLARQRLQAEVALLGPAERLGDLQFDQSEALLELRANAANRHLGIEDPNFNRADVVARLRTDALKTPQAQLEEARARRKVDVIGRAQTREGLDRDLTLNTLEGEVRALQDQGRPLEAILRLENARLQVIARRVALEEAQRTPDQAKLQAALIAAQDAQAQTDDAIRRANAELTGVPLPEPLPAQATAGQTQTFTTGVSAAISDTRPAGGQRPITVELNVEHTGAEVDYDRLLSAAASGVLLGINRAGEDGGARVPADIPGGR